MPPPQRNTRSNSTSTGESNLTMDQKLDLLLNDVAEIKSNNQLFSKDISEVKQDIKQFKIDISNSIDMCFDNIEKCNNLVRDNKAKIDCHDINIDNLVSENANLKGQITNLQKSLRIAEQYSRSNCLEVYGVPESKNEVILDVVKKIGHVLNLNITEEMVDAVHRLSKNVHNPNAPRGIIIKFCRRIDMERMREKTRVKNGFLASELGYKSEHKVFINLALTKETRILWSEVRAFKVQHQYKFAWITSAGKVFLRKHEGSPAILVGERADLDRLK